MEVLSTLWNTLLIEPLLNSLIFVYSLLFQNMALSIIVLTVVIRIATYPLTVRQLRMTRVQALIAPRMEEINRQYKGDPQRRSQETMALYREHGVSPLGCLGPLVIQMPIWIGLYWAIIRGIGETPATLIFLSQHLYSWLPPFVVQALPVDPGFLWLELTQPDSSYVLPVLVGASMWLVQKQTMPATAGSSQQRSTSNTMLWMMPIMFGALSITFPSGLPLYWLISNVMTVVMQYFIIGWGGLRPSTPAPASTGRATRAPEKEMSQDEHREPAEPGSVSADSGRSNSGRSQRARRRSRRGRGRRPRAG